MPRRMEFKRHYQRELTMEFILAPSYLQSLPTSRNKAKATSATTRDSTNENVKCVPKLWSLLEPPVLGGY
jgi:hypothetical protein